MGTNPFDTSFAFSNAAIGTFNNFSQAQRYPETSAVYQNIEAFAQDNWKVSSRLTLDYGMRFVFQRAQYDELGQASNFLPEKWSQANAPQLYRPTCSNGVFPCSTGAAATFRRALNPVTGQVVGTNTTFALLNTTLVPGSGNTQNGLFLPDSVSGQNNGVPDATYLRADDGARATLRGGVRPDREPEHRRARRRRALLRPSEFHDVLGRRGQSPDGGNVTQTSAQLQALGSAGLLTRGCPA